MQRITLIRHAQSVANAQAKLIGGYQPEVTLTKLGITQAEQLRHYISALALLDTIDGSISASPAVRTMLTCKIALAGRREYKIDENLRELEQGGWENMRRIDIYTPEMRQIIDTSRGTFRPPNGESQLDVADRMEEWLQSLPLDTHCLAFSHGMAIKCLVQRLIGLPSGTAHIHELENTGIVELKKGRDGWSLVRYNDCSHLSR